MIGEDWRMTFAEESEGELSHFGKKGMKWGVRKAEKAAAKAARGSQSSGGRADNFTATGKMKARSTDTASTKQAKKDYNDLSDESFLRKYNVDRKTYASRVEKHGDPYAHVVKDKADRDIHDARERQSERSVELQRQAMKTYTANGEKALKAAQNKYNKMEADLLNNPDAETAAKLTRGERNTQRVNTAISITALAAASAILLSSGRS